MRKIVLIEDDADLYYWLKILANSIYGFFVELIPDHFKQPKHVMVFSGDHDSYLEAQFFQSELAGAGEIRTQGLDWRPARVAG